MLIEIDKMLLKNEEVAKEFNQYFGHATDSLDLYEFPYEKVCEWLNYIDDIVCKFRILSSTAKLRNGTKLTTIFHLDLPLHKK